ncbi:MAG TPA: LysM peptidoglycan-binding domain-containing protein [Chloroflexota bacterium]
MTSELAAGAAEPTRKRLVLLGFIALMLAAGFGLRQVAGGPQLPDRIPGPSQVGLLLGGAALPLEIVAYVLVSLAWLVWLWIVASLALELVLVALEGAAHGAAWVGKLRRLAHLVTLPLARRAVAAAFAVQLLSRAMPVAAAPLLHSAPVVAVDLDTHAAEVMHARLPASAYLVRPGDTLWSIAERAYGSGAEYRRLVHANVGRRMADGAEFTVQGVIQPGWILDVPEPTAWLDTTDGARWYTVQPGDTLTSIAARVLGTSERWAELFELNRGVATPGAARALDNPDLIWPGLRLRLPDPEVETVADRTASVVAQSDADAEVDPPLLVAAAVVSARPDELPPLPTEPVEQSAQSPTEEDIPAESLPPLVRDIHPVLRSEQDAPAPEPGPADDAPASHADVLAFDPLLGAVGLAAAAGLATLGISRARRLRPLPKKPESEIVVEGGYAEAELAAELARQLQSGHADPTIALVSRFVQVVNEYDLDNVQVVAIRHGRTCTTLTVAAGVAEQAILIDLAPVFEQRLQVDCTAWLSTDQDVHVRLTPPRKGHSLPPADTVIADAPWFVPLGVLYDRQVYSVAWSAIGHLLVVGPPGHGADTILTSVLATVTARRSPEELRLWLVGDARALPPPVAELPHLDAHIDPAADDALAGLVARLRAELEQRALGGTWPELVILVPELTCLGKAASELQLLVSGAASCGVRVVASSTDPAAVTESPLHSCFSTRMVLRLDEEEHSVALLGGADAAYLGGGGRLLLRVDDREAVELYGYQVTSEHLERLVRVMRSAYLSTPLPPLDVSTPVIVDSEDVFEPVVPEPPADAEVPAAAAAPDAPRESTAESETAPATEDAAVPLEAASSAPDASGDEPAVNIPTPPIEQRLLVNPQAPIHITCFGAPRVLCVDQQVWPRMSRGDAKPWEMLLFLACHPIDGVAREPAIQALWPDDTGFDVTHRVRQMRYRLRGAFGKVAGAPEEDGICTERNGAFYLDRNVIYSDAQEFLELTRMARILASAHSIPLLERARALYTADLLRGPDARRYAWADERDESGVTLREHFRRVFQHATLSLAELYADTGESTASLETYYELTELDPGDERVWRALFRLHFARRDRQALIAEEHRMRATLRELALRNDEAPLGEVCEPTRETQIEYERLLARADLPEPVPSAI